MNTWTPGPWEVRGVWADGFGPRDPSSEPADVWVVDPVMDEGGYDGLWHGGVSQEPDARLIAAAPEMAELLADMAQYADHESGESSWVGRAAAILDRIRGES